MTALESLIVAHLIGDWLLQPHWMAVRKTEHAPIRAFHCLIWTLCFAPVVGASPGWIYWWLWGTHFLIDTYRPLYWFRKLRGDYKTWDEFKESFSTPAGFMVNVVFDQIFHLLTLIPVALWMEARS